jgi:hypothetical protein
MFHTVRKRAQSSRLKRFRLMTFTAPNIDRTCYVFDIPGTFSVPLSISVNQKHFWIAYSRDVVGPVRLKQIYETFESHFSFILSAVHVNAMPISVNATPVLHLHHILFENQIRNKTNILSKSRVNNQQCHGVQQS